ncbi:hypothetical protein HYALB_00005747 [Hymenoscyphus albidus]|uniref:DUF7892 domain-containing protein n=1 Tax=Hymenoscyphus albidus TaxID=595503 RepID=A0A9N9LJ06_9HELO|nr:hypothetical protein HYALB_00005747 [Hymenoscyphus albidus]
MDTPSSDLTSGSTESLSPTSADPTPADSPTKTTLDNLESLLATNMSSSAVTENNDESDSDVSMSADSDEENDTGHDTPDSQVLSSLRGLPQSDTPHNHAVEASKKRKHAGSLEAPNGQLDQQISNESRKRVKSIESLPSYRTPQGGLQPDKSLLPAEIWHHIFSFCLPRVLGLSLQVNKCFNTYLDPSVPKSPVASLSSSSLPLLQAGAIWRASRILFHQNMPGPLSGKSELDMWRMACSSRCQFCNKKEISSSNTVDQWHPGPGMTGLARVWSFGIRACGSCIQQNTTKEIDLLLFSAIASPLLVALPFIFLTNELHIIPPTTLQSGQQPSSIQISKRFPNFQIEEIKREFQEAKVLGAATTEEWLKGLEERGREMRTDAARWERWEFSGGVANMRPVASHEVKKEPAVNVEERSTSIGVSPLYRFQPSNPLPQRNFPPFTNSRSSQNPYPPQPSSAPPYFDTPFRNGYTPYPPPPRAQPQVRHERTKDEVASLKAARRAEIERRSMLLSPPLTAAVLAHMPSFQAAIQIIQPLTDESWEVLKPRLLSQRGEAEQRETDRLAQTRVVQERFDERRYQDAQARSNSKDIVDREWDDVQAPLRSRIGGYADEIIRDGWNGGDKVDYDNAPRFAADVLVYVRKRFYAEMAKDEATARATGQEPTLDPPNGPYLRKLILENMKWVFDTKIKVHTEQYRKELFLCSACETNPKFYGFEGVIQHYAAKHTNELSFGSIVVHWKAEWPERPPFNSDPAPSSNQAYYSVPSASAPFVSNGPALHTNYGYGGYQPTSGPSISAPMAGSMQALMPPQMQAPMPPPLHGQNPHVYQESPGPYYGHPHYENQYSGHQNGPYAPPQPYQDNPQVYHGQQQYSAPPPANNVYQEPPHDYSQHHRFGNSYQPSNQGMYPPANQGPQYQTAPDMSVQQDSYSYQGNHFGQNYTQVPSYSTNTVAPPPAPPQRTEDYKTQLLEVAKSARKVWNTINSIKEIAGSVKVHTIIYHLLSQFRTLYQEDPPLSMIIDGLTNNKDMRPLRNINGLLCKTCVAELTGSKGNQKKHFSISQLLSHFHTIHEQGVSKNTGRSLDWTKDMVELPDISKLASAINNGNHKLDPRIKLVKEAIPELDPPTATIEERFSNGRKYDHVATNSYSPELAPSRDSHNKYYSSASKGESSKPDIVAYDNGEYDPRNPMEIPLEPRTVLRVAPQAKYPLEDEREILQPVYRLAPHPEDRREIVYHDRPGHVYDDRRPVSPLSRARPSEYYERVVIREEPPFYNDRRPRYRESVERSEYRSPAPLPYHAWGAQSPSQGYQFRNLESFSGNRQEIQPVATASEQSRITDVVVQISQQAQRAQDSIPLRDEVAKGGSEDGEVRAKTASKSASYQPEPPEDPTDAAERFLDNFLSVEAPREEALSRTPRADKRKVWEPESGEPLRRAYQPQEDPYRGIRGISRVSSRGRPGDEGTLETRSVVRDRLPPEQSRAYGYDDRYGSSLPVHLTVRERSPELVDRRYKVNNVVYRDERQSRTPNRYARYESVRLENDRARSRSPVYAKVGGQAGQYRERSPGRHLLQETFYRARTPQMLVDGYAHERQPRPGYYRVYADEPRPGPQYATEAYELVRVSDAQGEYVIRRPIRREPAEPVYASYGDDGYARQSVYESRAPVLRPHEASFEEEYDPRHPEPLAPVRQVGRYQ